MNSNPTRTRLESSNNIAQPKVLDGRCRRATERRNNRREQLMSATIRVFGQKDYYQTSIGDILTEAGAARATFYQYFACKLDILKEFMEQIHNEICQALDSENSTPNHEFNPMILRLHGQRILEIIERHRVILHMLLNEPYGLDLTYDLQRQLFWEHLATLIEAEIVKGQDSGLIRPGNAAFMACGLLGCLKEMVKHRLSAVGSLAKLSQDVLINEIVQGGVFGLFHR